MNANHARRIVLIDPRFQFRLAASFLAVQLLLTGLFALGLYLFLDSELQANLASAHARFLALDRMLLPIVAVLSAFSLALSTVLVTVFVVLLSHRLAGPVFRFRTALEQLADRNPNPWTRIRETDQFGELARALQRATATVGGDLLAIRSAVDEAGDGLESAQAALARVRAIVGAWVPRS